MINYPRYYQLYINNPEHLAVKMVYELKTKNSLMDDTNNILDMLSESDRNDIWNRVNCLLER